MTCPLDTREQAELLVAYSSRQLDADKAAAVARHMADCDACREFVREQQALWEALDVWEAEPVSPDFNRRLYRRIESRTTGWNRLFAPVWPFGFDRGIPLVAAAAVVLVAGVMLDRTVPGSHPAGGDGPVAAVESLQPEQVVKALDEMQALSRFDDLMKPETPESEM